MKNGFSLFVGSLFVLGLSWCLMVLTPVLQLGRAKQTTIINTTDIYPVQRTGAATLGLQVYRANGCAACHTEQIQQTGMACDLAVTGYGKKPEAVSNVVADVKLTGIPKDEADALSDKITAAGGKAEVRVYATGPDLPRWGMRRSVAEDFLWDYPVQLGNSRVGPDLADVGARLPDVNWQLVHLYAPQSAVKGSVMPPFRYLFEKRRIDGVPSPEALQLPKEFAPPAGYEIVPTDDAKNLAAYLVSLRADVPLHDAPFTPLTAPKKKP
ncbi:MAG TPA: cbb3-type cytochrome c oxidase subunit II [Verrucomicrobiae bacterium]|nr:cbb3-type cytochrome c oxidase subunit II [Verrucomicrobiae bacterium]